MNRVLLLAIAVIAAAAVTALAWFALRVPALDPGAADPLEAAGPAQVAAGGDAARRPAEATDRASRAPPTAAGGEARGEEIGDGRRVASAAPSVVATVQSLSGRVMSPSAPIAGAEVVLSASDGAELARARTDGGGLFFLPLDDHAEGASLWIRAQGFATALRSGERVQRGERRNLGVLRLEPGVTVAGRVLDAHDAPVAGATIELRSPALGALVQRPIASAVSDRDGNFSIVDAPSLQLRVEVRAPGHGARALEPVDAPADDVVVRLSTELVLRARVLDRRTRAPLAGVRVELAPLDPLAPGASGTTDADGALAIAGLGATSWLARLHAPNYRTRSQSQVEAGAAEVLFELDAWPCVRGVVRAADGAVPSGATVELRATDASGAVADARARASGRCEADGRFTLCDLRPGMYVLEARADGYAPRRSAPLSIALERDAPEQTLVLDAGGAVHARVAALRGVLRDASVEAYAAPVGEAELLQAERDPAGGVSSAARLATAAVGGDGEARLEHLPDGQVWIVARASDQLAQVRGPFRVDAREAAARVEFELAAGARVRGRVLLGEAPVAGALVILRRPGFPGFGALRAVADDRGEYVSPLLPGGTWTVVARRQGGNDGVRSAEATVQVESGGESKLDLTLR